MPAPHLTSPDFPPICDEVRMPTPNEKIDHYFIDGSAFHQDLREFTLSGYAVVTADRGVYNFRGVCSGLIPWLGT